MLTGSGGAIADDFDPVSLAIDHKGPTIDDCFMPRATEHHRRGLGATGGTEKKENHEPMHALMLTRRSLRSG